MRYVIVGPKTPVGKIKAANEQSGQSMFPVVTDTNHYLGYVLMDDLEQHPGAKTAGEVLEEARQASLPRIACIHGGDSFDDALMVMRVERLPFVPVVDYGNHFIGTLDSSSGEGRRN
jgi:CBS domain-containing protein